MNRHSDQVLSVRNGAILRQYRQARGYSQRDLAFLARPCSQTTIYLIENGKIPRVRVGLAQRIAHRLGLPAEVLFCQR